MSALVSSYSGLQGRVVTIDYRAPRSCGDFPSLHRLHILVIPFGSSSSLHLECFSGRRARGCGVRESEIPLGLAHQGPRRGRPVQARYLKGEISSPLFAHWRLDMPSTV